MDAQLLVPDEGAGWRFANHTFPPDTVGEKFKDFPVN
jgi:hypothetical protein